MATKKEKQLTVLLLKERLEKLIGKKVMFKEREEFTVEDGIRVQERQLKDWESVLKPEIYAKLEQYAKKKNHLAKTGYDIVRGNQLDMLIYNSLMDK